MPFSKEAKINHIGDENVSRKTKDISIRASNAPVLKRTALGTITNKVRIQPTRTVKSCPGQDENVCARQKKFTEDSKFTIYVDEDPDSSDCSDPLEISESTEIKLDTDLISLPAKTTPKPTTDRAVCDSPMVLDASIDSETERLDREAVIQPTAEYEEDIYSYMKRAELQHRPKPAYMKKQPDITNSMRSILVDWLVEVGEEYKLHRETLFLAVNYIDRFLSLMSVNRGKLQLVGAASMFLAGKYEEIYPPDVGEFCYITDDTYTSQQILRMEHLILKVLSFDVAVPTANWFCERLLKCAAANERTSHLAMFLLELTLIESESYLKYQPSVLAATALCLANYTLGNECWPSSLEKQVGYSFERLGETLKLLYRSYCSVASHPQRAIYEKYKTPKYGKVSEIEPPMNLSIVS